jgi:hypothetical protein
MYQIFIPLTRGQRSLSGLTMTEREQVMSEIFPRHWSMDPWAIAL